MDSVPDVTLQDVFRARKHFVAIVRRIQLIRSRPLRAPAHVYLNLENRQASGAF